jgi:hypothetical protein
MKKTYFIFCFLLISVSCSKKNEIDEYERKYKYSRFRCIYHKYDQKELSNKLLERCGYRLVPADKRIS